MGEISRENLLQFDKRYRTTAMIYFAQLFTVVILIVLSLFRAAGSENSADSNFLTPLWIAVIFIAIGTFVLRRALLRWERLKNVKLLKGASGVLGLLQTNSIILGALAETIAVIGFIISELNGDSSDMLRAGLVSLIVFLINFPRKSVWRKIAASLEKV